MELKMTAVIGCDEHGCQEAETFSRELSQNTREFAADAREHFKDLGWTFSRGVCFCPKHDRTG